MCVVVASQRRIVGGELGLGFVESVKRRSLPSAAAAVPFVLPCVVGVILLWNFHLSIRVMFDSFAAHRLAQYCLLFTLTVTSHLFFIIFYCCGKLDCCALMNCPQFEKYLSQEQCGQKFVVL